MTLLFLLILPAFTIGLLFLKDPKKGRGEVMNFLLICNTLFYLSPLLSAFFNTPAGESMWDENKGGGAILWVYFLVLPLCALIQFILMTLKLIFAVPGNAGRRIPKKHSHEIPDNRP